MDGEKDVDLKTEIRKPRALAVLNVMKDFCENKKLSRSAKLLQKFTEYYLRYMISFNRQSRGEIVEAIKAMAIRKYQENESLKVE